MRAPRLPTMRARWPLLLAPSRAVAAPRDDDRNSGKCSSSGSRAKRCASPSRSARRTATFCRLSRWGGPSMNRSNLRPQGRRCSPRPHEGPVVRPVESGAARRPYDRRGEPHYRLRGGPLLRRDGRALLQRCADKITLANDELLTVVGPARVPRREIHSRAARRRREAERSLRDDAPFRPHDPGVEERRSEPDAHGLPPLSLRPCRKGNRLRGSPGDVPGDGARRRSPPFAQRRAGRRSLGRARLDGPRRRAPPADDGEERRRHDHRRAGG